MVIALVGNAKVGWSYIFVALANALQCRISIRISNGLRPARKALVGPASAQ